MIEMLLLYRIQTLFFLLKTCFKSSHYYYYSVIMFKFPRPMISIRKYYTCSFYYLNYIGSSYILKFKEKQFDAVSNLSLMSVYPPQNFLDSHNSAPTPTAEFSLYQLSSLGHNLIHDFMAVIFSVNLAILLKNKISCQIHDFQN